MGEIFAGLVDFLPWIFRILVVLFVMRVIRNLIAPARPAQSGRRPGPGGPIERSGGKLARDPQCGTYVPVATSPQLSSGRETLYFCSAACRDAYRDAHSHSSVA
jgi:YHS domain-containing protein